MNSIFGKFWDAAHRMVDSFIGRLPALIVAAIVFVLFYGLSLFLARVVRRATPRRRQNLGVVFARVAGGLTILVGFLVSFSIVAPSFQAADLIKILGISGVAIGFAFQNILQNFLAGLLLLWTEPFRVGDEIKLDKTYDERQVVIPNADLFTRSVIVNTAFHARRWEYDLTLKSVQDLAEIKSRVVRTVRAVPGVLSEPVPEALVVKLDSDTVTVRVLWWTNAPRQHQMLGSYDTVLTAISEALSHSGMSEERRAA